MMNDVNKWIIHAGKCHTNQISKTFFKAIKWSPFNLWITKAICMFQISLEVNGEKLFIIGSHLRIPAIKKSFKNAFNDYKMTDV